jgi:hypothetical protein
MRWQMGVGVVVSYTTYGQPKKNRSRNRRRAFKRHKNQLLKDEEEKENKEVEKIEEKENL